MESAVQGMSHRSPQRRGRWIACACVATCCALAWPAEAHERGHAPAARARQAPRAKAAQKARTERRPFLRPDRLEALGRRKAELLEHTRRLDRERKKSAEALHRISSELAPKLVHGDEVVLAQVRLARLDDAPIQDGTVAVAEVFVRGPVWDRSRDPNSGALREKTMEPSKTFLRVRLTTQASGESTDHQVVQVGSPRDRKAGKVKLTFEEAIEQYLEGLTVEQVHGMVDRSLRQIMADSPSGAPEQSFE